MPPATDRQAPAERLQAIPSGTVMPLYLQDDPQWAGIPYAGGAVADSGCGLVCASMAIEYMTTQRADPRMLADAVGDACLTDGVNDPGKFCEWIAERYPEYGIGYSGIYYDPNEALRDVWDGRLVFASVTGTLGDSSYGGHIVLLWESDAEGLWVRDPMSGYNSQRPLSDSEFRTINWVYFYSIYGGNYGS